MLADQLDYIAGVDPHRDSHAIAVVHVQSGAVIFETTVAADSDGYAEALKLAEEHAPGWRAFAVEGTGSFGAGLTRFLTRRDERVLEVGRLRRERVGCVNSIACAKTADLQAEPTLPHPTGCQRFRLRGISSRADWCDLTSGGGSEHRKEER
jgi:transposase